jgi:hypothetical protein
MSEGFKKLPNGNNDNITGNAKCGAFCTQHFVFRVGQARPLGRTARLLLVRQCTFFSH